MAPTSHIAERPAPSALQTLLQKHRIPPDSPHPPHFHHLTLQIAHNLRYQHGWHSIRVYDRSADSGEPLPRPMISGFPPQRLYVHPDEQIELLQKQKSEGKSGMPSMRAEREWVLPSHLREKWSLRRFGEVFDGVGRVPEEGQGEVLFEDERDGKDGQDGEEHEEVEVNKWRVELPKRLLLATLDDDSTVVYYIVHDGIVKPRQN